MSFADFLERADAQTRRLRKAYPQLGRLIPPFPETHVFYLGPDQRAADAMHDIVADLAEETRERVPMPFRDASMVTTFLNEDGQVKGFILDRLVENPVDIELVDREFLVKDHAVPWDPKEPTQSFLMLRIEVNEQFPEDQPFFWLVSFYGTRWIDEAVKDRLRFQCVISLPFIETNNRLVAGPRPPTLANDTALILGEIAAVSHPANYVVKVTPGLTPREARKVASGEPRPVRKSQHFIVVDHEVLVGMRKAPQDTHASPVPHHRRGHWARLAERCHHARLLGKDKVWRRPTFVGDRTWMDHKHHYEVLLDFNSKTTELLA